LNRLITTFDEVPPTNHPRFTAQMIMVLPLKRRPPKSSRPIPNANRSLHPRPARTPPSTFLFLLLHLSNSLGPKSRSRMIWEVCSPSFDGNVQPGFTGCALLIISEEQHRRECLPRSVPKQRRAQWWCLYGGPIRVSTVNVNKSSHRIIFLQRARPPLCTVVFWRRRAALEPQSCDDLLIGNHCESPATSGDHRLFISNGDGDPIARSCGFKTTIERSCSSVMVRSRPILIGLRFRIACGMPSS